jgi:hypothetical protein
MLIIPWFFTTTGQKVFARLWVGSSRATPIAMKTRSFNELYTCVREEFGVRSYKVYYLPPNSGLSFHKRIRLDSDDTLADYLQLARPRPPLLLYEPDAALGDSPNANPGDDRSVGTARSNDSRGSAQTRWADSVRSMCNNVCVACGQADAKLLDAAHLVPVSGFFSDKLRDADLLSCYDPRNGVLLCRSCHSYFDLGHWCVADDCFMVSGALQHYVPAWEERHECSFPCESAGVDTSSRHWPFKEVWDVRVAYFEEKQHLRRDEAASKQFSCEKCGKRYKSNTYYLREHQSQCEGLRVSLFTPDKLAIVREDDETFDRVGTNLLSSFLGASLDGDVD